MDLRRKERWRGSRACPPGPSNHISSSARPEEIFIAKRPRSWWWLRAKCFCSIEAIVAAAHRAGAQIPSAEGGRRPPRTATLWRKPSSLEDTRDGFDDCPDKSRFANLNRRRSGVKRREHALEASHRSGLPEKTRKQSSKPDPSSLWP